jgi:hypothetical protein
MTMIDPQLVEALLEKTIRETLRHGRNQTCLELALLPGGRTQIEGTFDLSAVASACLEAMERAGFKLVKV